MRRLDRYEVTSANSVPVAHPHSGPGRDTRKGNASTQSMAPRKPQGQSPWLLALGLLLLGACDASQESPAPELELPELSVTRWTERTELFMEHPALVAGQTARFAVHLTNLADFTPVTTGRVTLRLRGATASEFAADHPTRPGIYGVDVTPSEPGRYTLELTLESPFVSDVHDAGVVDVYRDRAQAMSAVDGEDDEGDTIVFLKEQQWTLGFGTTLAVERTLRDSLSAFAEVRPRPGGDADVIAPVSGRLVAAAVRPLGSAVVAGDVLGEIVPRSLNPDDRPGLELAMAEAEAALQLATLERARVDRLLAVGAVPGRRLDDARVMEERAQAAVRAARARLDQLDVLRTGTGDGTGESRYAVRAPIAGVVAVSRATPGSSVEVGDRLFRLVAIDTVHVIARVPETSAHRLGHITAAEIDVPGAGSIALGQLLSRGRVVDEASRTVPVVFEWQQPDPRFAIGQVVQVRLLADAGPAVVAVPESALVDDGGRMVVFVHMEGESFARRPVLAGRREGGFVEVREGIAVGERVVSRGAPLVRLAALSPQVPAHGHVH
jgi:membrane fusion protein, heavy metal efflux system